MNEMVKFTISDIAPGARKVSRKLDSTLQTDCTMHCLNLCIGYGVGLKEIKKLKFYDRPIGNQKLKRRVIVTGGGEFPEGSRVIRELRNLNKYFASATAVQRGHMLTKIQQFNGLPELVGLIGIDVRVASVMKLLQRSIINYPAFQWYFQSVRDDEKDKYVFTCISVEGWNLIVEMEAVVRHVAELALAESLVASTLSSTMYVLP
ncbi:unnamed protein product [Phytophthora fragariaefolia]|uniref:Unnamed protein product n=1 Tax=Phytophthora fragariaefolia TaxID=1490495 RepID=A0A9W6XAT6_9STRA|nr:unnamed protein product [Phytophthora fragariaefolia]